MSSTVTIADLKWAIDFTVYNMRRYNMPGMLGTLKRLDAELERRLAEGDAFDCAARIQEKYIKVISNDNRPSMRLPGPALEPSRRPLRGYSNQLSILPSLRLEGAVVSLRHRVAVRSPTGPDIRAG